MNINKSNNSSLNKVCVIGAYFGKLPNYFSLWLKSCEYNPDFDFIIVTDNKIKIELPNIYIISTTLTEIKEKAENIMGFECSLERPYKMCDYKPIYGLLFREFLLNYDYWGHCDFDVIFGDLRYFFKRYNLYDYDRINSLGHLSFYRNTEEINNRFKLSGAQDDYKTVFQNDKSFIFDELPGMTRLYFKNGFSIFTKRIFIDVASLYRRYRMIDSYEYDTKAINYKYQIFYWDNGKVYHAYFIKDQLFKDEYLYIHFKKRPNFYVNFDPETINAFYITPYGFIPKNEEPTKEIIKTYNKGHSGVYEYFEKNVSILKIKTKNKIVK